MLFMTAKAYDDRYWFEEVCFEFETNGFCNNLFLITKRVNAVHDNDNLYKNCTDLKRSASNLKLTFSATTIFLWWNISMLSMTAKSLYDLYWFEEVCFESENNGFCNNVFLIVERLNVVHDSQSRGRSVLFWRSASNMKPRVSAALFSYCEASQCCLWQPAPWIICTDLNRFASNMKPTLSAATYLNVKRLNRQLW